MDILDKIVVLQNALTTATIMEFAEILNAYVKMDSSEISVNFRLALMAAMFFKL